MAMLGTWNMAWKAAMSWAARSSCRQSSPDLTMTGLRAQPARLPWGLSRRTRAHFSANLRTRFTVQVAGCSVWNAPGMQLRR